MWKRWIRVCTSRSFSLQCELQQQQHRRRRRKFVWRWELHIEKNCDDRSGDVALRLSGTCDQTYARTNRPTSQTKHNRKFILRVTLFRSKLTCDTRAYIHISSAEHWLCIGLHSQFAQCTMWAKQTWHGMVCLSRAKSRSTTKWICSSCC